VLGLITTLMVTSFKNVHTEPAAVEGKKVVLSMLAAGSIFILVIAVGEVAHHVARARRRDG
jgi:hypothetical protein